MLMVDITHKSNSLRHAKARATVELSSEAALNALKNNEVPKGNVFETARVAALYAAKRTADMIPDCHPLPVEYTSVDYQMEDLSIHCEVEIKTIYKTGVEVEAMHAASVAALTMYDMLKPLDKNIHIRDIHLLWKKGGKSDKVNFLPERSISAAVIVCSDSVSSGKSEDKSGKWLMQQLPEQNIACEELMIVPDDPDKIKAAIEKLKENNDLVVISGGTGVASRDNTSKVVRSIIDKELSGIAELARAYSNERMPYSFLSQSISGIAGKRLILSMPGSLGAVKDYYNALFPEVLHVFKVLDSNYRHSS